MLRTEEKIERLDPVARDYDLVGEIVLFERAQGQRLVIGIVFDQQDQLPVPVFSTQTARLKGE